MQIPPTMEQREQTLAKSDGYTRLVKAGLLGEGLSPWSLEMPDAAQSMERRLRTDRDLEQFVVFAMRHDRGEVACLRVGDRTDKVYLFDWVEQDPPFMCLETYKSVYEWLSAATEDSIWFDDWTDTDPRPTLAHSGAVHISDMQSGLFDSVERQVQPTQLVATPDWLLNPWAPGAYGLFIEDNLLGINLEPWQILSAQQRHQASTWLSFRQPEQQMVVFARRGDSAALACWDVRAETTEIVELQSSSPDGMPQRVRTHDHFYDWYRSAIFDFINFSSQG